MREIDKLIQRLEDPLFWGDNVLKIYVVYRKNLPPKVVTCGNIREHEDFQGCLCSVGPFRTMEAANRCVTETQITHDPESEEGEA